MVGLTTNIWYAVLFGAAGGICIGLTTEYYTASTPVVNIIESGKQGQRRLRSLAHSCSRSSDRFVICNHLVSTEGGLKGVVLPRRIPSHCGYDHGGERHSPVADNAGGIAEMVVWEKTPEPSLIHLTNWAHDSHGGQRLCHGAAALAAPAIIAAFVEVPTLERGGDFVLHIGDPNVLIGLFIGGLVPFLIASITMTAVGDAAMDMTKKSDGSSAKSLASWKEPPSQITPNVSISRPPRH